MKKHLFIVAALAFVVTANAQWAITTGTTDLGVQTVESTGGFVFAGSSSGGVWRSGDFGTTWNNVNTGLTNTNVKALAFSAGFCFAGTANGVFISTDNGDNWSPVNTGLTNKNISTLAVTGTSVFAGTDEGVFVTGTNGALWKQLTSGLPTDNTVNSIAVYSPSMYVCYHDEGLHIGQNAANFTEITNNMSDANIVSLVMLSNNLLAGVGEGVYSSTNGGASWAPSNSGLPYASVRNLYAAQSYVFAAHDDGKVYASNDAGASWHPFYDGLNHFDALCFTWHGTYLFLANRGSGVWRRPIAEGVTIGLNKIGADKFASVFPNPTTSVLNVNTGKNNGETKTIHIYDAKGRLVLTKTFTAATFSLHVAELPAGLYLYRINTTDQLLAEGKVVFE